MDLFERIPPDHRARLEAAAATFRLGRGEVLMRRGERGGDIYRVAEGVLEIVDPQVEPPIVIGRIGAGAVVGEMAFIDERVRSADVRAAEEAVCQHWPRDRLMELLASDPDLGMSFYRAMAELVTARSREFRTVALSDGLHGHRGRSTGSHSPAAALEEAEHQLFDALKDHLRTAEPRARSDRDGATAQVVGALDSFTEGFGDLLGRMTNDQRMDALDRLRHDMHPYLVRSHFAELAMDGGAGRGEGPEALAHLIAGRAEGDGVIGEVIDQWLLARPTAVALRARQQALLAEVETGTWQRVLVVNGAAAGTTAGVSALLAEGVQLSVLEHERRGLDERALGGARPELQRELHQEDLAMVAMGEQKLGLPAHDLVVMDGLCDYLPDRALAELLWDLRRATAPGGRLLATALAPSDDQLLFSHVLSWPTVRRQPEALVGIAERVGFRSVRATRTEGAGTLLSGVLPAQSARSGPDAVATGPDTGSAPA